VCVGVRTLERRVWKALSVESVNCTETTLPDGVYHELMGLSATPEKLTTFSARKRMTCDCVTMPVTSPASLTMPTRWRFTSLPNMSISECSGTEKCTGHHGLRLEASFQRRPPPRRRSHERQQLPRASSLASRPRWHSRLHLRSEGERDILQTSLTVWRENISISTCENSSHEMGRVASRSAKSLAVFITTSSVTTQADTHVSEVRGSHEAKRTSARGSLARRRLRTQIQHIDHADEGLGLLVPHGHRLNLLLGQRRQDLGAGLCREHPHDIASRSGQIAAVELVDESRKLGRGRHGRSVTMREGGC